MEQATKQEAGQASVGSQDGANHHQVVLDEVIGRPGGVYSLKLRPPADNTRHSAPLSLNTLEPSTQPANSTQRRLLFMAGRESYTTANENTYSKEYAIHIVLYRRLHRTCSSLFFSSLTKKRPHRSHIPPTGSGSCHRWPGSTGIVPRTCRCTVSRSSSTSRRSQRCSTRRSSRRCPPGSAQMGLRSPSPSS